MTIRDKAVKVVTAPLAGMTKLCDAAWDNVVPLGEAVTFGTAHKILPERAADALDAQVTGTHQRMEQVHEHHRAGIELIRVHIVAATTERRK